MEERLSRDEINAIAQDDLSIQPPRCIRLRDGEVWWSGIPSAISIPFLVSKGIKHVINLGVPLEESLENELKRRGELKSYTFYPVFDTEEQNILPAVNGAVWIVKSAHEKGEPVLVHCFAGRNRSGAVMAKIVADEFMREKNLTQRHATTSAISYLRLLTKNMALTNRSFISQLLS